MQRTLEDARTLVGGAGRVVAGALERLTRDAAPGGRADLDLLDREQLVAYDLAGVAALVAAGEALLTWGESGELQADLTLAYAGHVASALSAASHGRTAAWGVERLPWSEGGAAAAALEAARAPALLDRIGAAVSATPDLPRNLNDEQALVRRTVRDFVDAKVRPVAEAIHREDRDVPEDLIAELAAMGCFGLTIPAAFGGAAGAQGGRAADLLAMLVVTEELSRGSLGAAGSLITRPEILARALLAGGSAEQQQRWLPAIAAGERMCAVAVTEPDHGSDVANLTLTAVRQGEEYVLNGVKTWCTFAGRAELLMVLARTGAAADGHRGLSLFVVEKPPFPGHAWVHDDGRGGRLEARAIGTLGYRGMHSFELAFADLRVPAANLVGETAGLGRGFYLQLDAFANGRLQTAARALGVMQAAFEDAATYVRARRVFGVPLASYQLTRGKLATMAHLIAACRWFTRHAAEQLAAGQRAAESGGGAEAAAGQLEAAMAKSLACHAAEWITREAQQLHGGYGYAEEYAVSRYFVDARVLSLFEGADETLALRMIIRRLIADARPAG